MSNAKEKQAKIGEVRARIQIATAMRNVMANSTAIQDLRGNVSVVAADALIEENRLYLLALEMDLA